MNKWLRISQDWLLPRHCLLCFGPSRGLDLCAGCRADLPLIGPACSSCGVPLPAGNRCARCLAHPPPVHTAFIPYLYAPPLSALIHSLKFTPRLGTAAVLGALLAERLQAAPVALPQALVPVPLHPARQRRRGFNQAVEIARPVARCLELKLMPRLCRRIRATAAQSGLASAGARRKNLSGAFSVNMPISGLDHVAIIDDVVTTGATATALARCLRSAGVARVDLWSVARAASGREPA